MPLVEETSDIKNESNLILIENRKESLSIFEFKSRDTSIHPDSEDIEGLYINMDSHKIYPFKLLESSMEMSNDKNDVSNAKSKSKSQLKAKSKKNIIKEADEEAQVIKSGDKWKH